MSTIARRRPAIPAEYGIAQDNVGLLTWSEVSTSLAAAPIYWIASVTPSARPHLIPIWGMFTGDRAYLEGGDMTRWARNLAGDAHTQIGVDHAGMQIMVRGTAERITVAEDVRRAIADGYDAKYPYRPTGAEFWRVTPDHVLAWKTDTIEAFVSTPTQFDFGGLA